VNRFLEDQGLPVDENELLIVRERKGGGRTASRLNGSLVSVGQLKSLSGLLVDLHGQHQSYGLTKPSTHLPMLDRMAGPKHAKELELYRGLYQQYLSLQREIREMETAERDRLREMEWLSLELDAIDKVSPKAGEFQELEAEIRKQAASEDLAQGSSVAVSGLGDDGGVLDGLSGVISALEPLQKFDEQLISTVERLQGAEIEIREVFREMSEYAQQIEHDPRGLDKLQQRAEEIKALCRKYGPTVDDVIVHRAESERKLERFENSEQITEELKRKLAEVEETLSRSAAKLSKARRKASGDLGAELVSELAQLAMPKVAFEVEFRQAEQFGPEGKDGAQFLFSPNPGRPPTPLAETASGGELSRVMLALVSILSRYQAQPTLVFDEIDVGLGGRTAEAVARKLSKLAQKVQVLCVTHLPVVAAAGTGHLVVEKVSGKKTTRVNVARVVDDSRVEEVARMLSGGASQKRARELAVELLAQTTN
jgi:DNA repair protein RecN (Recombination protein N)